MSLNKRISIKSSLFSIRELFGGKEKKIHLLLVIEIDHFIHSTSFIEHIFCAKYCARHCAKTLLCSL